MHKPLYYIVLIALLFGVTRVHAQSTPATVELGAKLRIINKISTDKREIIVPIGSIARMDKLEIRPMRCWTDVNNTGQGHALMIEIYDARSNTRANRVFSGWVFANHPSLHNLEHPYYDVTFLGCRKRKKL